VDRRLLLSSRFVGEISTEVRKTASKTGENQMSIIGWIILGLIAGFIASKIVEGSGQGLFLNIALGIVGAIVGGFLYSLVLGGPGVTGVNIGSIIVSIIGAIIVLWVYNAVASRA
jgi:uncharacterized membrane protein YeaQ/YmgE (transglycosylase-associated protein family)